MFESSSTELSRRCSIVHDPHFAELGSARAERLEHVGTRVSPQNFASLLDPLMREAWQQGLDEAGAHEGTIWLLESEGHHLVPAYNTGPNAHRIVGTFRQPLNEGLICMVFASEQPFVENVVHKNARQSRQLDGLLQEQTYAFVALPFYFLKCCRGVASCVLLRRAGAQEPEPPGFSHVHLAAMQRASSVLSRLLEYRLLSSTVGWQTDS